MTVEVPILQAALVEVSRERSILLEECSRWEAFREEVRLTKPAADPAGSDQASRDLLESYRITVMSSPDFEAAYGDTLESSLRQELSPGVAETLLSGEELTPLVRRKLLVGSSAAIERRADTVDLLDDEREFVETTMAVLGEVRARTATLPPRSLRGRSFDELLEIQETYDELERICQLLAEQRQRSLHGRGRTLHIPGGPHALAEYLYRDLETSYPVLSAIATTAGMISRATTGSTNGRITP